MLFDPLRHARSLREPAAIVVPRSCTVARVDRRRERMPPVDSLVRVFYAVNSPSATQAAWTPAAVTATPVWSAMGVVP